MKEAPAYDDDLIRGILTRSKTIAMIGASPNPARDSYEVMRFLQRKGHKVIPVNPTAAGQSILGETVVAQLSDIDGPVQMVDVFRRSEWVPPLVDEVLDHAGRLGVTAIWMQLGVRDDAAAAKAEATGIDVIMNRCPVIEYPRLGL